MPKKRKAYRHRIDIQRPLRGKDAYNNLTIDGYETILAAEPASRESPLGFGNSDRMEKLRGGQVQSQISCIYRIREPRVVVDSTMRVVDNGVAYEIDAVVDADDRIESGELLIFVRAITDAS